jgi:hypothetical protein
MDVKRQITIIAALHIGFGSIFLLVGILGFIFFTGIGIASCDPEAVGILGILGFVGLLLMSLLAVPGIVAGVGLLKYRPWARILTMIVSCFYLFAVPIGTAFGVYCLWIMTENTAKDAFENVPKVHSS